MVIKRIRQGAGLHTDASPLDVPEGAMLACSNVMLHRPGLIVPRPGIGSTVGVAERSTSFRPIAMEPHNAEVVIQSKSGSSYRLEALSATTVYATADVTPPGVHGRSSMAEMRDALYVATSTGIRKLLTGGPTYARAGLWTNYQVPNVSFIDIAGGGLSTDYAAVDADSSVAYRWCVFRTDVNGYKIRSAPSSRRIVRAPSATYASGIYVELGTIILPTDGPLAGDVLELYRTRNSASVTSDPGSDYYLVTSYTLTAADITNGFTGDTIWRDQVNDDLLGVSLYSSQSQLGALASKEVAPQAACLASWGNVMWAGDVTDRLTHSIWVQRVRSGAAFNEEGLSYVDGTYSGTSGGGLTLTGVALSVDEWASLAATMWVSDGSIPGSTTGRIPATTAIVSFDQGASTITLNAAASGTGAFKAGDVFSVRSVQFYAYSTEIPSARAFDISANSDPVARAYETALSLAYVISYNQNTAGAAAVKDEFIGGGDGEILLIARDPWDTDLEIETSKPSAIAPDTTGALQAAPTRRAGSVAWSGLDEPDAWPPINSVVIGDSGEPVLALVPLTNALLVFKADGVYRVTGSGPSNWVVDEVDLGKRLIAPSATAVLDGACYAWTDRGVYRFTEAGADAVPISAPIAQSLRQHQELLPKRATDHARAFWLESHRRLGLVIVSVGSQADSETSSQWYVWHQNTGAWSTWGRPDRIAAYVPESDVLLVASGGSAWDPVYERSSAAAESAYSTLYDADVSLAGATFSGAVITVATASLGDHNPTTCDVIGATGEIIGNTPYYRILSIEASGTDTLFTLDGDFPGAASGAFLRAGYQASMTWQPQHASGLGHRWSELHAEFTYAEAPPALPTLPVNMGGAAHRDASTSTVAASLALPVEYSQPLRAGLPRACVRTPHFYPHISICSALTEWELSHVYVHGMPTTKRVDR